MRTRYFLLAFLFSFGLEIVLSQLRGLAGGFPLSSFAGFICYFLLTIIICRRYSNRVAAGSLIFAITLGLFAIQIPVRLLDFKGSLVSLPDFACHLSGIFCGWAFVVLKQPLKWFPFSLGLAISFYLMAGGYDRWLFRLNFGTFTGAVQYSPPISLTGHDQDNHFISDELTRGKTIFLDFWHTRCGICFEEFPALQSLYDRLKADTSVIFYAVNKPLSQDKPGQAVSMLKERNYTFPVLIPSVDTLPEAYGVEFYPTIIIIDRTGTIIYRGDLAHSEPVIRNQKRSYQAGR